MPCHKFNTSEFKDGATLIHPPSALEEKILFILFRMKNSNRGGNKLLPDFGVGTAIVANSPKPAPPLPSPRPLPPPSTPHATAKRDMTDGPSLLSLSRRGAARSHWEHLCQRGRTCCCHGLLGALGCGAGGGAQRAKTGESGVGECGGGRDTRGYSRQREHDGRVGGEGHGGEGGVEHLEGREGLRQRGQGSERERERAGVGRGARGRQPRCPVERRAHGAGMPTHPPQP